MKKSARMMYEFLSIHLLGSCCMPMLSWAGREDLSGGPLNPGHLPHLALSQQPRSQKHPCCLGNLLPLSNGLDYGKASIRSCPVTTIPIVCPFPRITTLSLYVLCSPHFMLFG